jgi:serine-type D-Ala-D-Ala carboxypeptidase/endopeptidase (penicillin-binding protein 4)
LIRFSQIRGALFLSCMLPLVACTQTSPTQADNLKWSLQQQLLKAGLPEEALAFVAYPLHQPEQLISIQQQEAMQPASTMKLVTSIVALERLGPGYRGKTLLLAYETPQAQMSQPLVLKGLASMDFNQQELWSLLQQAYDQGIRQIPAIEIDRSFFTPARPEPLAMPFDETPREYYNLQPDALFLQRNMLSIKLTSTASQISGQISPMLQDLALVTTEAKLTETGCDQWYPDPTQLAFRRQPDEIQLVLQGSFATHCEKRHYLQLVNRVDFSRLLLQQLWQQISGQADIPVIEKGKTQASVVIAQHQSRALAEVLRDINKSSDNAITRQLYLTLGANQPNPIYPTTAEAAAHQVRQFISQHGLDPTSLVLENGSGLSRTERISPELMAALLHHAYQAPYQMELIASMPLSGVDGTLKRRLNQPATKGKARLKTGTLRNVTALAGYVTDQSGRTWVVASFINDPKSARGKPVLDYLIEWISQQQLDKDSA